MTETSFQNNGLTRIWILTVKYYACNHGDQEHTNTLCKVERLNAWSTEPGVQEHQEYR